MKQAARTYLDAGLCVLPAHRAEKRPAIKGKWEPYKTRLPTTAEVDAWFANDHDALCLVCGDVSGNLEMTDFDFAGELFDPWCKRVRAAAPGLLEKLVIEGTQSDGWHTACRYKEKVCGSMKLAQRKRPVRDEEITLDKKGREVVVLHGKEYAVRVDDDGSKYAIITLIETRGEGGLFLCDPTEGYALVQGDFRNLPVLTAEERDILLRCAWELNEYVPPVAPRGHTLAPGATGAKGTAGGPSGGGLRPGDDFNARGDVRAVLQQHGWTLAKGGENEYWRRPGKETGTSATLKDRVLYVFTSNAPPFEPDEPYSPFRVYALLEHAGDFEQAASALRAEGYGSDEPDDGDVDVSAIVAKAEACLSDTADGGGAPHMPDPGPIPERLFHVPGLVAQVMDFTLTHAPYPNLGLAFCGGLALQSFLCGRKVQTSTGARPNIYLLALASSGTGKDYPRKVNSRVLFEIGQIAALGDKFASGQGIQDALLRSPAMLFQNDEMDGVLRQINFDHEGKSESIPSVLLTVFTSADDVYPVRVKAGQKEAAHIDQPHLTLFGTATPQHFYESLSQRMLTNGLFARMIVVDIGRRGRGQLPGSVRNLPDGILSVARWWAEFTPGTRVGGNLYSVYPEPRVVPFTPEAAEALTRLQRITEDEWSKAHERKDEPARTAWSRTCENATKLALIYASSENHEDPVIGLPAAEWATAFAMHQTRRQLYLAATYVAENPFHAECLKLLRKLREAGGQMGRRELMRAMRCKAADFDQIVGTLLQQGDIDGAEIPTKTKPAQGYRAR